MKNTRWILTAMLALLAISQAATVKAASGWTNAQVSQLRVWAGKAPDDALPVPDTSALDRALAGPSPAEVDKAASELALRLAYMHLLGCIPQSERGSWRIADSDAAVDLPARLASALAGHGLDTFFRELRPDHTDYAALRRAYATETDSARRETIARNMERWRWLPRSLGRGHILVNAANFEARLWQGGIEAGTWKVIVGKPSTPTPIFAATVRGVIINPWWTVPASIIRERKGRFPTSQGYIRSGREVRQRPGPNNALGVVKLDMPNTHSVYLHDTPSKALFDRPVRAFSHGCVRVSDAIGLATTLVGPGLARAELEAIVATGRTTDIALPAPLPIYVAYFTAGTDVDGKVVTYPDIYGRDVGKVSATAARQCGA